MTLCPVTTVWLAPETTAALMGRVLEHHIRVCRAKNVTTTRAAERRDFVLLWKAEQKRALVTVTCGLDTHVR